MTRRSGPVGIALFPNERELLLRALRELAEREEDSRVAADLTTMLERAAPMGVFAVDEQEAATTPPSRARERDKP
jgi:hypothetical protein